ncbi:hypothetical protein CLOSYM_00128, partial [[Clostridium] symbiosum ATCC 14940]
DNLYALRTGHRPQQQTVKSLPRGLFTSADIKKKFGGLPCL